MNTIQHNFASYLKQISQRKIQEDSEKIIMQQEENLKKAKLQFETMFQELLNYIECLAKNGEDVYEMKVNHENLLTTIWTDYLKNKPFGIKIFSYSSFFWGTPQIYGLYIEFLQKRLNECGFKFDRLGRANNFSDKFRICI